MQPAIKALIFCKHTFVAYKITTHLRTKQKAKHFISNEIIISSLPSLHSIMESAWTWNPNYNHFQFSTFSHHPPTKKSSLHETQANLVTGNPDRNWFFHFYWTHIRLLFSKSFANQVEVYTKLLHEFCFSITPFYLHRTILGLESPREKF